MVIGGRNHDITNMSRKERAECADDGIDPLAEIPEEEIREGDIRAKVR